MVFSSEPTTLYEGVWKIERVEAINEKTVLVSFTTAFFNSENEAEDPTEIQPRDYGPRGESTQTVAISSGVVPSIEEFNSGERHKIYNKLTEELDFETITID